MMNLFKKYMSLVLVIMMIVSLLPNVQVYAQETSFSDAKDHWAFNSIEKWISRGTISGYADGTFKPDGQITRAEFMSILNSIFGFEKISDNQFADVSDNLWYADEVLKAREAGYFQGAPGNVAMPNDVITRQDASVMIARVFELDTLSSLELLEKFIDQETISDYARGAVSILVSKGAITGHPDNTFKPTNSITRAEVLTILDGMIKGYYNIAGTYTENINGTAVVAKSDVILKNITIDGDLYLTAGIGEGDFNLENVTVKGTTFVSGGGENSVTVINSQLNKVIINKKVGKVRFVAKSSTISSIYALVQSIIDVEEATLISSIVLQEGAKGTQVMGKDKVSKFEINVEDIIVDGITIVKGEDPKTPSTKKSSGSGSSGGSNNGTNNYSVAFNLNGASGTAPTSENVAKGSKVTLPSSPTRDGYTFAGWYTTKEGNQYEAFNTNTLINQNMTLYAQWIKADHVQTIITTSDGKTTELGYSNYSDIKMRKMSDNSIVPEIDLQSGSVNYGVYKDLNKNGTLEVYEDWRQDVETRTEDLAMKMSYEEIAGLMLYSGHQMDWTSPIPTQAQVTFLANDDLRHILIAREIPAEIAAPWNNDIQALSEKFGLGIPANNSSDPRHSAAIGVEYYSTNTGTISLWPNSLGLAATFDPSLVYEFGKIASTEYRALGITTALSPQIDIATEPRWNRTNGTFGEDPALAAAMTEAYVQGFQGTFDQDGLIGWGSNSVNAMIKHWPGGGAGEGGRDAHNDYGKYSVFPGNNFDAHTIPFVDGGLQGSAKDTTMATAVMPYYTISYNVDPSGKDVANAFSDYMLIDLLREKYNFDGVICTDWGVDSSRGWGPDIEALDTAHRAKILIEAGVDQFGGQNTSKYILEAVQLAKAEGSEASFRVKMEESASRLLKNIFRTGLFENPYLDEEESKEIVANDAFVEKGYEAQVKSIVMVKNKDNILPLTNTTKVYVPKGAKGNYLFQGVNNQFTLVDNPDEADVAIVPIISPRSPMDPIIPFFGGGWTKDTGYFPLTLQYSEYTAVNAREVSIAGDYRNISDNSPSFLNRTYKDKKMTATNFDDLKVLLETKEAMGNKPVITVLNMDNPPVFTEIDTVSDAVLIRFASSDNAVLDILSGNEEPSGLLPIQIPKSMADVEAQLEDLPRDMECYVDSESNTYDFAFGLNWSGIIHDERVVTYRVDPLSVPESGSSTLNAYVTITTHTLPICKIGTDYEAEITSKETDSIFDLVNGTLPNGLTFDNGVISGIATEGTDEYGNQLTIKASADGKEDRIFRMTIVANDEGGVLLADPNELSIAITLASFKQEANYTDTSWVAFSNAFEAAKTVYENASTSSQTEIDTTTSVLKDAIAGLVRI